MFMAESVLEPRSACSEASAPSARPWSSQGQAQEPQNDQAKESTETRVQSQLWEMSPMERSGWKSF